MRVYSLAETLGKTVGEIMQMSVSEFRGWIAYFNLKNQRKMDKNG